MEGYSVAARAELLSEIKFGLYRRILISRFNTMLLIIKYPGGQKRRIY